MNNLQQVGQVCSPCGITANYLTCLKRFGNAPTKISMSSSTFNSGTCDVCGKRAIVTEPRDYFNPDFTLLDPKNFQDVCARTMGHIKDCAKCRADIIKNGEE